MKKTDYLTVDGVFAEDERILLRNLTPQDEEVYMSLLIENSAGPQMYENEEFYSLSWNNALKDKDLILIIIDKATQQSVGNIMLQKLDAEEQEIGVDVLNVYKRQHYAYDAVKLLVSHASAVSGSKTFKVRIYDDNNPSLRLFEKFHIKLIGTQESEFAMFMRVMEEQLGKEKAEALRKESIYGAAIESQVDRGISVYRLYA